MRRLLWKEWHEVRWYLPVLLLSVLPGVLYQNAAHGGQTQVLEAASRIVNLQDTWLRFGIPGMLMLIWGITRNSRNRNPSQMSLEWMPSDRLRSSISRFASGLLVCILLSLCIMLVVSRTRIPTNELMLSPGQIALQFGAWLIACYTLGYSLSLLVSGLNAAILTLCLLILFAEDGIITLAILSLLVTLVIVGSDVRPLRDLRVPEYVSAILLFSIFIIPRLPFHTGGFSFTTSSLVLGQKYYLMDDRHHAVAYRVEGDQFEDGSIDRINIWTPDGTKLAAKRKFIIAMSWLPDGNLLMESDDPGSTPELLEWDRSSGKVSALVRLPTGRRNTPDMMKYAWPNDDGSQIALFSTSGDLWILDRKQRLLRLRYPELLHGFEPYERILATESYQDFEIRWKRDRLILRLEDRDYLLPESGDQELTPLNPCWEAH